MARSTSSQHANLIREMSRDISRSSKSSGRSQGSASPQPTISDFDPENEAIMSTQQLDNNAQRLPALRASAQKYNRFSRPSRLDPAAPSEPDYAINTSAIGRAFPDFSQGSASSDDGSMSIEIGRGAKKASNGPIAKLGRSREYSSNIGLDLDENSLDFAAPLIGNYEVMGTPPLRQRQVSKKVCEKARGSKRRDGQIRQSSGLRQEINEISPPPVKQKDYGSGGSGKGSGDHGRTLAAMHARVRNENDQSRISDDRPPTIDLTVRNTRFSGALPTKYSSAQGLTTASGSVKKNTLQKTSAADQGTQQSFLLPDMPNMSELVSGVYEDGTPVFSRHGKSRSSRFTKKAARGMGHADVDEIPIAEDEQAIFLSLKLLQDKIAVMEKNQAENEQAIQDLEQKNQTLESERLQQRRRVSRRSDSALGTTDSDGDEMGAGRKLTIEKNRLASSVQSLQGKLDASNRKIVTAETILRTITQERDSAVSQLSVAYVTIEQLKAENAEFREENEVLRGPIGQQSKGHEDTTKKSTAKIDTLRSKPTRFEGLGSHSRRTADQPEASTREDVGTMFDVTSRLETTKKNPPKVRQQTQAASPVDSEDSIYEASRNKGKGKPASKPTRSQRSQAQYEEPITDLTYLSFLDSEEVAKLRKTLEQERVQRKHRQSTKRQPFEGEITSTHQAQGEALTQHSAATLPKKSSMKDLTSRSIKETQNQEATLQAKGASEHNRRHSETSILSTHSRRRGMNANNMTSAFILPDITIRASGVDAQKVPELSQENRAVLEELAQHSGDNCTVCKRSGGNHDDHQTTITVPKPVPVSERMPLAGPYEEEPTVRPSQAPGLALAIVLKGLEDEISHLKIQLAKYQDLYNGHDPALSKRKRKSVYEKMESLAKAIDVKSDQIYALYDVLEGQKQDGHEISEQEVEITLQCLGVDAASLHLRGGGAEDYNDAEVPKGNTTERHPWDLSSEDESNEDLPWEGIESTVETTKSGFARANRRRSTAA